MNKWENWLNSQNEATQIYFRNRMKEDNPIIIYSMLLGFCLGFFIATLILI